jgi:acetate---CoA ligase (ADP-forming)
MPQSSRPCLRRVCKPRSVAIVGISESSPFGRGAAVAASSEDVDVVFVHPKHDSVFGRPCYPDLTAIGRPVDAVFSVVSAKHTISVIEEASRSGAGGVITAAGGFAEMGDDGRVLQDRMIAAAAIGNLPIIGPNGVGFIDVARPLNLSILPSFPARAGGVSVISSSGALLEAIGSSAWRAGGVGFNVMISSGNEPVTDVADYLEYLVDDPGTRIIALAVEKVRRPQAFFAAARRARDAGKPILAIKFGRRERAQRMAQSHTGTLTGDGWVYEVAFKQANIQLVSELDEMVDRMQLLEQLPRDRWTEVRGLAVLTMTGGLAAIASDIAEDEHIDVPDVPRLDQWIGSVVPGATVANPLDATAFHVTRPEIWDNVVEEYSRAPEFDACVFLNQFADWDDTPRYRERLETYVAAGESSDRPFVISPLAGPAGRWTDELRARDVAVGNGLRGALRGFQSMAAFMRSRPTSFVADPGAVPASNPPSAEPLSVAEGRMLPFAEAMSLLAGAGIPVAEYALLKAADDVAVPRFAGPYVVKLADVAHRTEHGAVLVGVPDSELGDAVAQMRELAHAGGLPATVAIQPMIDSDGEAFIGLRGDTELGPLVAFGLGGIFVEVLARVGGRLAPFELDDAHELLAEFDDVGVMNGLRGSRPWDREQLAAILVRAGRLVAAGRGWIGSVDINPLIFGPDGFVAVDGLCLIR